MLRRALSLWPLLGSLSAWAQTATLAVDGGEDDEPLERALVAELPVGALVPADADLALSVRQDRDVLRASLTDRRGQGSERRFSTAEGRQAALRRVVLLVARAHRAMSEALALPAEERPAPVWEGPPEETLAVAELVATRTVSPGPLAATPEVPAAAPAPAAPIPAVEPPLADRPGAGPRRLSSPPVLRARAGFAAVWWNDPGSPSLGPELSVATRLLPGLEAGLSGGYLGWPAVRQRGTGISGEVRAVEVVATGALRATTLGPTELWAELGLGASRTETEVQPDAYQGPAPSQRFAGWSALVRGGPELRIDRETFGFWLAVGLEARPFRPRLVLHELYRADALDPGFLSPWARAGMSLYWR